MSSTTDNMDRSSDATLKQSAVDKRRLYDKIATGLVTTGGIAVIFSIIAILFFIAIVAIPLWESPEYRHINSLDIDTSGAAASENDDVLAIGTDQYREMTFLLFQNGITRFISNDDGRIIKESRIEIPGDSVITSSYTADNNQSFAVGTSRGNIYQIKTNYRVTFPEGSKKKIIPEIEVTEPVKVLEDGVSHLAVAGDESGGSISVAAVSESGELVFYSKTVTSSLFGDDKVSETTTRITGDIKGRKFTDLEIDSAQSNMFASTREGKILEWDIRNKKNPLLVNIHDVSEKSDNPVTNIGFLIGDRSLIVGEAEGELSIWFHVNDAQGNKVLKKVHTYPPMHAGIRQLNKSERDRGFIASDDNGNVGVYYATTEQKRLEIPGEGAGLQAFTFTPKANGIITLDQSGTLDNWFLSNPHPETTFKTLFGKVWYEGYEEPAYVWQSTGATDTFEPKLSITPLAYGTIKGAIYALIFAIPIAILSAICVSQFVHPSIRNFVKPVIEVMAALPSVVLGFFAGLWMAPRLENYFPAVLLMPFLITIFTFLALFIWKKIPVKYTGNLRVGTELFFLLPAVIIAIVIALWLNFPAEFALFGSDYKTWFYNVLGLQYDQRNALVVGFAMGFAVIPIIFTISEDSLSSVPKNLTAGSLALGANRWQTATQIVLPSASPGIFSAVMIGLGRAVGETMIVLMATGNTPIMDWSFFNGFRAMSANIAVELPEAPHEGTLYRVLFLTALLLFVFTFLINTLAEIVRQRLRKKYGRL